MNLDDAKVDELLGQMNIDLSSLSYAELFARDMGERLRGMQRDIVREWLATLPGEPGWIAVEDRLPDNHQPVLAWCGGRRRIARVCALPGGDPRWIDDRDDWSDEGLECLDVTRWRPLPEPPDRPSIPPK